jgi:uncharacterized protein Veg
MRRRNGHHETGILKEKFPSLFPLALNRKSELNMRVTK